MGGAARDGALASAELGIEQLMARSSPENPGFVEAYLIAAVAAERTQQLSEARRFRALGQRSCDADHCAPLMLGGPRRFCVPEPPVRIPHR